MATSQIARILIGTDGKLHPIIRALIYSALAFWLFSADEFLGPPLRRAATALHATGLSPGRDTFYEVINLLTALLLTWIFARYEGRRVEGYGLPVRQSFGARFWEGFAIGVANAAVVAAGMMAFGGMTMHGLALHGTTILGVTLAWLGSNMLVGVAEEYLFPRLPANTMEKLGFWAAAVLRSRIQPHPISSMRRLLAAVYAVERSMTSCLGLIEGEDPLRCRCSQHGAHEPPGSTPSASRARASEHGHYRRHRPVSET